MNSQSLVKIGGILATCVLSAAGCLSTTGSVQYEGESYASRMPVPLVYGEFRGCRTADIVGVRYMDSEPHPFGSRSEKEYLNKELAARGYLYLGAMTFEKRIDASDKQKKFEAKGADISIQQYCWDLTTDPNMDYGSNSTTVTVTNSYGIAETRTIVSEIRPDAKRDERWLLYRCGHPGKCESLKSTELDQLIEDIRVRAGYKPRTVRRELTEEERESPLRRLLEPRK